MKDLQFYLQEVLGLQNLMMPSAQASSEGAMESFEPGLAETLTPPQTETATKANIQFFTQQGPVTTLPMHDYELVFLNILTQAKESLFKPEVFDLFSKMRSAMKIKNIQVLEMDCLVEDRSKLPSQLAQLCESKVVVVFSSFPKDIGEMIFKGPGRWLETYSPAYLLEDPAAKKVVWNDLQKVMKELGL